MNIIEDKIRKHIMLGLRDFASDNSGLPDLRWSPRRMRHDIERNELADPGLALFLFREILQLKLGYREEKTHWVVPFKFKNIRCVISFEKFGLFLYIDGEDESTINVKEILGKIDRAIRKTEKNILSPFAQEQISLNNITIINNFNEFTNIYKYFRKQSDNCFLESEQRKTTLGFYAEGTYNSLAMIDSYFSRLEHFLVLAFGFRTKDMKEDNLGEYVAQRWSSKYKRILPLSEDKSSQFYNQLVGIKEKYRNTYAHGGFEKKGASFFFHLPNYGAIPASLTSNKSSINFGLYFIDKEIHISICEFFDKLDQWLENERLSAAWSFALSGLDLPFDKKSLEELRKVSMDAIQFTKWLKKKCYLAEMYRNADY